MTTKARTPVAALLVALGVLPATSGLAQPVAPGDVASEPASVTQQCASALDRARAQVETVLSRIQAMPRCPTPTAGSLSRLDALAAVSAERDRLAAERDRLAAERDRIGADLRSLQQRLTRLASGQFDQFRKALAATLKADGPCESMSITAEHGTDVAVAGKVGNLEQAKRLIAEAARSTPGLTVTDSGLASVSVCGIEVGSRWIVQLDGTGHVLQVGRNRIAVPELTRTPSPAECEQVGVTIDNAVGADQRLRSLRSFWINGGPSATTFELCERDDAGGWVVINFNLNLGQSAALVVRREH